MQDEFPLCNPPRQRQSGRLFVENPWVGPVCCTLATLRRKHHGVNKGRLIAATRAISWCEEPVPVVWVPATIDVSWGSNEQKPEDRRHRGARRIDRRHSVADGPAERQGR